MTQEELENAVMNAYISSLNNSDAKILQQQYLSASVLRREFTGVGFYIDFKVDRSAPRLTSNKSPELPGVYASIDGLQYGAGFELFIENGEIVLLEGYTYDEKWPTELKGVEIYYDS